jgi:hypothetical protein
MWIWSLIFNHQPLIVYIPSIRREEVIYFSYDIKLDDSIEEFNKMSWIWNDKYWSITYRWEKETLN